MPFGVLTPLAASGIQGLPAFMLDSDILAEQGGRLGFGRRGERRYGRRHCLDLLSSFASPVKFQVRPGPTDLGAVDPLSLRSGVRLAAGSEPGVRGRSGAFGSPGGKVRASHYRHDRGPGVGCSDGTRAA